MKHTKTQNNNKETKSKGKKEKEKTAQNRKRTLKKIQELEITNHKNETTRNDTKLKELTENSESRKKQDARSKKQGARSKAQ